MKKTIFSFVILFLVPIAILLFYKLNNPQESVMPKSKIETITLDADISDEENYAYLSGYVEGQNALFDQMSAPIKIVLKEEKKFSYVIQKNQNEKIKEISHQGYVDGYHKASESYNCPRTESNPY